MPDYQEAISILRTLLLSMPNRYAERGALDLAITTLEAVDGHVIDEAEERRFCAQAWHRADAIADFDRTYWLMAHRDSARRQVTPELVKARARYQELKAASEKAVQNMVLLGAQALGYIRSVLREHEDLDEANRSSGVNR